MLQTQAGAIDCADAHLSSDSTALVCSPLFRVNQPASRQVFVTCYGLAQPRQGRFPFSKAYKWP